MISPALTVQATAVPLVGAAVKGVVARIHPFPESESPAVPLLYFLDKHYTSTGEPAPPLDELWSGYPVSYADRCEMPLEITEFTKNTFHRWFHFNKDYASEYLPEFELN